MKNKEVLDAPNSATQILFNILKDVNQNQEQHTLFDEEFNTQNNTFVRFTMDITDIAAENDYSNVKKGLDFLQDFKRGWYKSKNAKGKTVKSLGGFISQPRISEGKKSFLMSVYWLKRVIELKENMKIDEAAIHLLMSDTNNKK